MPAPIQSSSTSPQSQRRSTPPPNSHAPSGDHRSNTNRTDALAPSLDQSGPTTATQPQRPAPEPPRMPSEPQRLLRPGAILSVGNSRALDVDTGAGPQLWGQLLRPSMIGTIQWQTFGEQGAQSFSPVTVPEGSRCIVATHAGVQLCLNARGGEVSIALCDAVRR